ncbi:MAG: hypothetical protein H7293_16140 [Candidatus Saccharibacteria bacterium]|nr:hypothetical protein [Rhodoferax sp.]
MNPMCRNACLGIVLSASAMSVLAQTAASTTPGTVGVEPSAAREAIQKAVPRSDTGTVVRTAPSVAARASDAMSSSTNANTTANTTTAPADSNMAASQNTNIAATARPLRAARPDRN